MNRIDPDRWKLIERLYNSALELDPGKRDAFLKDACAGDEAVTKTVKRLLDHHEEAEDFFNVTPLDVLEGVQSKNHTSLPGKQLSTYKVISEIGRGGMGEVYQATDLKLERDVAIKVLIEEFSKDDDRVKRFKREAKLLASLSHPNIAAIYGLEESDGKHFLAMELVHGDTLADRIKSGPIPAREALEIAIQIAGALGSAHEKGVIHRDLKPSNIKVQPDGTVKVLDFGLAKQVAPHQQDTVKETLTYSTDDGTILGTLPYMSPEQLRGKPADARSDIFSLGIILFEMLTGEHPFRRESNFDIAAAILNDTPPSLSKLDAGNPAALTTVIHKMIAKKADDRYQNLGEVKNDLSKRLAEFERKSIDAGHWRRFGNAKFVVPALTAIVVFGLLAVWNFVHENKVSWARNRALPQILELIPNYRFEEAYRLAAEAEKYIPGDPQLEGLLEQVSSVWSIHTDPPDARIYIKDYAGDEADWKLLGNSPLENVRITRGFKIYKIIKDGFAERYGILGTNDIPIVPSAIFGTDVVWTAPLGMVRSIRLAPDTSVLPNMVYIDGGYYSLTIDRLTNLVPVQLNDYQIDKFEVTNREYMAFVNAGGYQERKYWKNEFIKDNRILSRMEAMAEFVDKTGQPGPATWEFGRYPDGMGNHPVNGVSWYEAAAYAEFAGKRLPSVYHWNRAANPQQQNVNPVVLNSNFAGSGTSPVGSHLGIGPNGTYDMAGNVREWCWNEYEKRRVLLGGSWGEPEYMYISQTTLPPMDRNPKNGFRLMKTLDGEDISGESMKPIPVIEPLRDLNEIKPVSDEIFDAYCEYFRYEKTPLEPRTEAVDDSAYNYILETVSFNAAYDNERITAYIFIPKSSRKPYQPIIYFPGASAQFLRSVQDYNGRDIDLIVRSGRAAIFPVYWGTFQRMHPDSQLETKTRIRDQYVKLYKDLASAIDYLETRPEFDLSKLTYYGYSWGSGVGSVVGALEKRIKGFIFLAGGILRDGLYADPLPQYDATIFAPRITAPVLMISGLHDVLFPSVRTLYDLLGTPENDKKIISPNSGHAPDLNNEQKKEFLDWLNRHLGQVHKKNE